MNILPLHNNSKTLCFMNSPKIWTKNFISYLKESHTELYVTITNILRMIYSIVFLAIISSISYIIGYNCIETTEIIKLTDEIGPLAYVVISILGSGAFMLVLCIFTATLWTIDVVMMIIIFSYMTICEFIVALKQYNATAKNLNV
jgi:hypothetical protein